MRLRLPLALGLILSLGCMCGDMGAFQQGMDQALVENFVQLELRLQALPPTPQRKAVLELCSRGQADAAAGTLELVKSSVWLAEVDAAIADGDLSDDEVAALTQSYDAMLAGG
jgi:hypothetical protein